MYPQVFPYGDFTGRTVHRTPFEDAGGSRGVEKTTVHTPCDVCYLDLYSRHCFLFSRSIYSGRCGSIVFGQSRTCIRTPAPYSTVLGLCPSHLPRRTLEVGSVPPDLAGGLRPDSWVTDDSQG